jgi:hypothetical protein
MGGARREPSLGWRFAASFLLAVCLASCSGGDGDQSDGMRPPRASFDSQTYDFGHVEQGAVVRHAFRFHNEGDVALSVVGLRNACDCNAHVAADDMIGPGGVGAIEVAFDTAAVHGSQSRTVTVYTNDPNARVLMLTLTGDVGLDVAVSRSELYTGGVTRGTPIENDVNVLSENGARKVTSVESSGRVVRVQPSDDGGLALAIAPDAPLGNFAEDVLLYTMSHRRPLLRLHVRGNVLPDVVVSPAELDFDSQPHAGSVRHILITNQRPERPIHVTGADLDERLGRATVEVVIEGLRYRVEARLNDTLPPGERTGSLVVRTDHPEQARIEVPVVLSDGARPQGANGNARRDGLKG